MKLKHNKVYQVLWVDLKMGLVNEMAYDGTVLIHMLENLSNSKYHQIIVIGEINEWDSLA